MDYRRYAIYYTPAPGPLSQVCSAWLGWDMATGNELAHPDVAGLPLPVAQITETPRKYGLHATMKPPFRLAQGATPAMLDDALASFCAQRSAVTMDGLELARLGRFLALRPLGDEGLLNALAADIVRGFDAFRARPIKNEISD